MKQACFLTALARVSDVLRATVKLFKGTQKALQPILSKRARGRKVVRKELGGRERGFIDFHART